MTKRLKINSLNKYIKTIVFIMLAVFALSDVAYSGDIANCVPARTQKNINGQTKSGNVVECPNGKKRRDDIDVKCVAGQAANNCIDIMPVQNKSHIDRIPEDVCFRNDGWDTKRDHNGMDYSLGKGEVVTAAADGVVKHAGWGSSCSGNGRHVRIEHNLPLQDSDKGAIVPSEHNRCFRTLYLHLSEVLVSPGKISKGDPIGRVGGSGCKSGANSESAYPVHLHFEMSTCGGATINPMCDELSSVCPKKTITKSDGTTEEFKFNPNACRNCAENAAQCNYAFTDGDASFHPSGDNTHYTEEAAQKTCELSKYRDSFTTCIFCDIFKVMFDTASDVAAASFKTLSAPVSIVVIIALAIWLSFTILKYISSFEQKEPRTMIKEILSKILLVLFVLVILYVGPQTFFNYTLEPIFNTGMEIAIMTTSSPDLVNCTNETFQVRTIEQGGALPESMGVNILCVIKAIQDAFLDIMSLGSTAICIGFFEKSFKRIPIFPHLGYVITGLGLWIAALLIIIIYPWLLVDSVLKLSVTMALLPAAIGAYAFDMTKKYTMKVWETFMNSMLNFMFLSIILFVLITMIDQILEKADFKEFVSDNFNPASFIDKLGWWTAAFLQVTFAILLGWAVLDEGSDFASDFSGGMSVGNIGSSVGTLAMSGVKGAALPVAKGAGKLGKKAGKAIGETVREKASTAKLNRQARRMKNSKNTVIDKDGNMSQTYKSWTGKQITKTLRVDANGNKSIERSKTDSKGNVVTTNSDKFMNVTVKKDKDGNVVGESFDMKAAGAKHLLNKDGTVNQVAVNAIMQNSTHNPEIVQKAIMQQMIKERFGDDKGLNRDFQSREIKAGKDENGNTTFEVMQKNKDGSMTRAKMTLGQTRAKLEIEETNKKGTASKTISSDGVFKKVTSTNFYSDGSSQSTHEYGVDEKYNKGRPVDSLGTFSKEIQNQEIMYSEEEIEHMKEQFIKGKNKANFTTFK